MWKRNILVIKNYSQTQGSNNNVDNRRLIQRKMTLVAAAISGDEKRVLDFQKELRLVLISAWKQSTSKQYDISFFSFSFILGVINGREILIASTKKINFVRFAIIKAWKSPSVINTHKEKITQT